MEDVRATGVVPISSAGLKMAAGATKSRIESVIRRLLRPARATDWAMGIFDSDFDLIEFDVSRATVDRKHALEMLYTLPLPESRGCVTFSGAAARSEDGSTGLGAAAAIGPERSAALVLMRGQASNPAWLQLADAVEKSVGRIADLLAADSLMGTDERRAPTASPTGHFGFFLLTQDLEVEFEWHSTSAAHASLAELVAPRKSRLPLFLQRAVRRLTLSWNFSRIGTCVAGVAYPIPGIALRVVPMRGAGVLIGVFLEEQALGHPLEHAAALYRISPREREVLHALLDGHSVADIATTLNLAESTVNDHIARMIVKTNASNRIEMAATLLGWPAVRSGLTRRDGVARLSIDDKRPAFGGDGQSRRVRSPWRHNVS
jgi:DNA-binding CsgD family transcriptional regulator